MKLWIAFTKMIRNQCSKNYVIDTIYFGTFLKADMDDKKVDQATIAQQNPQYVCLGSGVKDPKSVFFELRHVTNTENISSLDKQVSTNITANLNFIDH